MIPWTSHNPGSSSNGMNPGIHFDAVNAVAVGTVCIVCIVCLFGHFSES